MSARLLLIEDDSSIARFVALALEELDVDLVTAGTLAEAREQLAQQRFAAVITDLMLPDGSSIELMEAGHARQGAPWIAFSAGLTPERLAALHELGVRQTLRKPVSLTALMDAVSSALQSSPTPAPVADPPPPARRTAAIDEHFAGDAAMFEAFLGGCLTRFADDLQRGHAALASADLATLRHVSHGLKAVLSLIGEPALAQHARDLEDACAANEPAEAARHWPPLAQGLEALRRQGR